MILDVQQTCCPIYESSCFYNSLTHENSNITTNVDQIEASFPNTNERTTTSSIHPSVNVT